MVPRLADSSSLVMPTPASLISRVRASLSGTMRILASGGRASAGSVSASKAAVGRVGGIGHQFAQEDLALGVEGMNHEVEQPPDLRAELMPFRRCRRVAHAAPWPKLNGQGYAARTASFSTGLDEDER